jgi:hypothetical protein
MADFETIQAVKQALMYKAELLKEAAMMTYGEEGPCVGLSESDIEPADEGTMTIKQTVSEQSLPENNSPTVMKVVTKKTMTCGDDAEEGVTGAEGDSPISVSVGEDSVESVGRILDLLRQLGM